MLDCLKPAVGSTTVPEEISLHLPRDIGNFEVSNIIAGPLHAVPEKGRKWKIPTYPRIKKMFDKVLKLDRALAYNNFSQK